MKNTVTVRNALRFVLVGAVLLTGACSSKNKDAEAAGSVCPKVGVLADAAQLVEFSSTERNMGNVVYRAEIVNAAAECDYSKRQVDLTLTLQFHAARGPSSLGRAYQFRYFVAVTDPSERILAKEVFELPVLFNSAQDELVLRDKVEQIRIPLKNKEAGMAYQVLVGFDLTTDQVIYNRVTSGLN